MTVFLDNNCKAKDWCYEFINDKGHPAMKRMVQFSGSMTPTAGPDPGPT